MESKKGNVENLKDCYYYYYSACKKGNDCPFRHEPLALKNETMCLHWLKGKCIRKHCTFRHMELNKNRNKIPCFHESQPKGCLKPNCPFLHVNKENFKASTTAVKPLSTENERHQEIPVKSSKQRWMGQGEGEETFVQTAQNRDSSSEKCRPLQRLTSFQLAKILSEQTDMTSSVSSLADKFPYLPRKIERIAKENPSVFGFCEGDVVSLRPKIEFCDEHFNGEGCETTSSSTPCTKLHICVDFVLGKCGDNECLFGHSLKTNHNKAILDNFKLGLLSPHIVLKVLREFRYQIEENSIKICLDYNEGRCLSTDCNELHLCLKSLARVCPDGNNCDLNHDFNQKDVRDLFKQRGMDDDGNNFEIYLAILSSPCVKKAVSNLLSNKNETKDEPPLKTVWCSEYIGEVPNEVICYDSVEGYCANEVNGCSKLHSNYHFHWQIYSPEENKWINLPSNFVLSLERAYCDPLKERVLLPSLDITSLTVSTRNLLNILKGKSQWEANFEEMLAKLKVGNDTLKLRRLNTEYKGSSLPKPCIFLWYFLELDGVWTEYGKNSLKNLKCNVDSSYIEKKFEENSKGQLSFNDEMFFYTLDFEKMVQTNLRTNTSRKVRRRPMPHLNVNKKSSFDLPDTWEDMEAGERLKLVKLLENTDEYLSIWNLATKGGITNIKQISRIQTPYFLKAFLNRVEEMTVLYGKSSAVNIQRLFHGTNPDIVPKICEENFDWRLHGSNVGQVYGRGTYFTPSSKLAYSYASPDVSGFRYLFVARVAVGSVIKGNSNMTRPPINPTTNLPYDSTVDSLSSPCKIVKYDKQEYYPEYLITLT